MNKLFLLLAAAFLISSCHRNPENITIVYDTIPTNDTANFEIIKEVNLTFQGVLPCADCGGILTNLVLNTDSSTYKVTETYQGKHSGDTVLTAAGSYIRKLSEGDASIVYQLNSSRPEDVRYFKAKGDSAVVMLDKQQKEIAGKLNYNLLKK